MRNLTSILLTFIITIIFSCNSRSINSGLIETDSLIIPSDSNALYLTYPSQSRVVSRENGFADKKYWDTVTVRGSSYVLFKIKEPILSNYQGNKDIFRFTWSRTFDTPLCIRIEKSDDRIWLTLKVLKGQGGYSIPEIAEDTTVNLSKEKWDKFISEVEKADFWDMQNNNYDFGFDGATWLLEGVQSKTYHWVERWSPGGNSSFGKACQYLVSIAPIKINPKNIY